MAQRTSFATIVAGSLLMGGWLVGVSSGQTITTVAGGYTGDGGPASAAKLDWPSDVFVDGVGNVYIADYDNGLVRKIDTVTGDITTVAGGGNTYDPPYGDGGAATEANVPNPEGVFVDGGGNIYIADPGTGRIRKVDGATGTITTVAGGGSQYNPPFGDGGPALDAVLANPAEVFADGAGNLYIADRYHYQIRKVDAATGIITTVAGNGSNTYSGDGGLATAAGISFVGGVHVDGMGNIYLTDINASVVRKVDTAGTITAVAGGGSAGWPTFGDGGSALDAQLQRPSSVAVDADGNIYIGEDYQVRKVDIGGIITTVAGGGSTFPGDGLLATQAQLGAGNSVYVDGAGNIYIGDKMNNRVCKVDAVTGIITTLAGRVYTGDGGPATSASFQSTSDVSLDGAGNIYVADANASRIRKVEAGTGVISAVAGGGSDSYSSNIPATSAALSSPQSVFAHSSGDIYLIDQGNRVRRVEAVTGNIATVAGGGNNYAFPQGDGGPATEAVLSQPSDLYVDGAENIYIADTYNHRIRKVDASTGNIETIAGDGNPGYSGDGGPATSASLSQPVDVELDGTGNLFIADMGNRVVRKVDASGNISTVAGGGTTDWPTYGDGGPATSAQLNWGAPRGLYVNGAGDLFIAEQYKIRKVNAVTGIITTVVGSGQWGFGGDGGSALQARLNEVEDVEVVGGFMYIADARNDRIRRVDLSPFISEITPATGLAGAAMVYPGTEAQIFSLGLTGDGEANVSAVTLTLDDLSPPTGLSASDFSQLKLYRSTDAVLDAGDIEIGAVAQNSINIGSPTVIPTAVPDTPSQGAEWFYLVSAVLAPDAAIDHAFRVGFEADGVTTSLGGRGTGFVASDADRVTIKVMLVREVQHIAQGSLPTVDGNISEWETLFGAPHLAQADFLNGGSPMDEADQKVEVWLGWNEQTDMIYVAARVTDDAFGTTTSGGDPGMVWQSDDMEVYLDADRSGGYYDSGNAHAQQYVLNPGGTQGAVLFPLVLAPPPQAQSAVQRNGTVYTYELAIPGWDLIDADGNGTLHDFAMNEVIGLELAFADFESNEDADNVAYHAFNSLDNASGGYFNADVFSAFRLVAPSPVLTETTAASGLTGALTSAQGTEVKVFGIGISGAGEVEVSGLALTLSDLSTPTGLSVSDFSYLKLYSSADAVLDHGDTQIGSVAQASINIGSPTLIPAAAPDIPPQGAERFYLVSAVLAPGGAIDHAFRVGFEADGVATSLGGRGTGFAASDADKVTLGPRPTYELPKTNQPPALDGVRTTGEWAKALVLESSPSKIASEDWEFGANDLVDEAFDGPGEGGTDADVSSTTRIVWDDTALYFITEVRDNAHDVANTGGPTAWWERDSISLYVDLTNANDEGESYTSLNIINYVAAPQNSSAETVTLEYTSGGSRVATQNPADINGLSYGYRDAGGEFGGTADYVIEGKIPWSALTPFNLPAAPANGTIMGLSIINLDPDGEDGWGGQIQAWGSADHPRTYTDIRFAYPSVTATEPTPAGDNVTSNLVDPETGNTAATLNFANVVSPGETTLQTTSEGPPPPAGFQVGDPPITYEIATTATFAGAVGVCIDYTGISFADESALKLFHFQDNAWADVTTSLDINEDLICGSVASLSPFGLFEQPAPPIAALTGSEEVLLGRQVQVSAEVLSGGDARVEQGTPQQSGLVTGSINAVGDVRLGAYNHVAGEVNAGGVVQLPRKNSATVVVDGAINNNVTIDPVVLPPVQMQVDPAGAPRVKVKPRKTLDLAPGTYGVLEAGHHSTLTLHSGTYYFERFVIQQQAQLIVQLTNEDPLTVNIKKGLHFGHHTQVAIQGGDAAQVLFNVSGEGLSSPDVGAEEVQEELEDGETEAPVAGRIGHDAHFAGTIYAPQGTVRLGKKAVMEGGLVARRVRLAPQSVFSEKLAEHLDLSGSIVLAKPAVAEQVKPASFALLPNYPNPFNPETTIRFELPQVERVRLEIYSVLGQKVRTLIEGELPAGTHAVRWDGRDESGQAMSSGVYFYRLEAGALHPVGRMMLLR